MNKTRRFLDALLLCLFIAIALPVNSQDIKAAARDALTKWEKAIISVRVVAKMKTSRSEEENQYEVTGSVIDASGLTVVSAQSIDPAAMIKAFFSSTGRATSPDQLKFDSDITQTTMIMKDGTEIEADIVLKDMDLDFAFVRPRKTSEPFTFIPTKPLKKPLEVLQDVFAIQRLDRSRNRVTSVTLGMVQAVVKGPRTFYLPNQEFMVNSLGCIAFTADGQPAGLIVSMPRTNTGDKGMSALIGLITGGGMGGSVPILRPLEDLQDGIQQAKEAKAPQSAPSAQ